MRSRRTAWGDMWDVFKVFYMTTEEVRLYGDKPRVLVAHGLTFDKATALVQSLGWDHSMHQSMQSTHGASGATYA